jgi:agmatinase
VLDPIPAEHPVVLCLDCDAFDPSVAPGVNAPSPGGFFFHEVIELVHAVAARFSIAGLSVVELVPGPQPRTDISATAAARLTANVIGLIARGKSRRREGSASV